MIPILLLSRHEEEGDERRPKKVDHTKVMLEALDLVCMGLFSLHKEPNLFPWKPMFKDE